MFCGHSARVADDLAPTDPTRQLLLIWDAMCDYVSEQLQQAKGVTIKDFGALRDVSQSPAAGVRARGRHGHPA